MNKSILSSLRNAQIYRNTIKYRFFSKNFYNVKALYNEKREKEALSLYFKDPDPFAASFLISRQEDIESAFNIYQAAKTKQALDLQVMITLINTCRRYNPRIKVDELWDETMEMLRNIKIEDIDSMTWSSLIMGLCHNGRQKDAEEVMTIIEENRIVLNDRVYNSLLATFTKHKWLDLGKKLHSHLIQNGYYKNNILKNCLIRMYAKCEYLEEALKIFNDMKSSDKDIITWNTIISAHVEHRKFSEALNLFQKMQSQGVIPDETTLTHILNVCCQTRLIDTGVKLFLSMRKEFGCIPNAQHYTCLLNACAENGLLALGKQVHAHLKKTKCPQDTFLKNSLINMYAKSGCLEEALEVFNDMKIYERDKVTWTAAISAYAQHNRGKEALEIFEQMQKAGIKPDQKTMTTILNACSFSGLVAPAAEILFSMERKFGLKPEAAQFNSVLVACTNQELYELGKSIHSLAVKHGYENDKALNTNLIKMYAKCGDMEESLKAFNNIEQSNRDILTWTAIISAYGKQGKIEEALAIFRRMQKEGHRPDAIVITCILSACTQSGSIDDAVEIFFSMETKFNMKPIAEHYCCLLIACGDKKLLELGKRIHNHLVQNECREIEVMNCLINMYSKCGCLDKALEVFNNIDASDRDVITWNTMIFAFAKNTKGKEALNTFKQMIKEGIEPKESTIACVLNACNFSRLTEEALKIFHSMESRFSIKPNSKHCSCIVEILCKAGRLEDAENFITTTMRQYSQEPSVSIWKMLLDACNTHSDLERAERISQIIMNLNSHN